MTAAMARELTVVPSSVEKTPRLFEPIKEQDSSFASWSAV